jgi:nitrogen fixation protein FixH
MRRLSWGSGIALGIGIFILAVLVMVGISFFSKTDLVTDRYYERGIQYQERISILERTAAREEKLVATVDSSTIAVVFPRSGTAVTPLSGTIVLYRPSDRARDLSIPVAPDSAGLQRLPTSTLDRGLWHLKVSWREGELEYYSEQSVMLL